MQHLELFLKREFRHEGGISDYQEGENHQEIKDLLPDELGECVASNSECDAQQFHDRIEL